MKTIARVLSVAVAVGMLASVAGAEQVTNDAFGINLPTGFGAFTKQAQPVDAKKIETTNWISKSPTGEAVVVTVSKLPGKILDPTKMMASTRDGLIKSLNATIESDEKAAGDMPSEHLTFHNAQAFLRSRLVVDNDRLVQLLYVGRSADQRALPGVAEMFNSFHVNGSK
jgi:hypothetical protein